MTSQVSQDSLLQAVRDCAALAGDTALRHYRRGPTVEQKADGSPVTIADRSAEEAVRVWIQARFPNDGILGEEFGERTGTSGRRWIVDPIDGTRSFVRGVPLWGSLVAVCEGDRVLAGAASFPAVGEIVAAAVGCGSWHNDSRAAVSDVANLANATALITDDRFFDDAKRRERWLSLASKVETYRTWGDAFGYLMVATGRAEIMADARITAWDIACFVPIIEEAGGVFTDLDGVATAFGKHSIATNAGVSTEVRSMVC